MKNLRLILVVAVVVAVLAVGFGAMSVGAGETKILEFDSMVGLPSTLTGTQNPIRNVNGGGLPWTLTSATGELKQSGKLEIDVTGLVFAAGPNVGKNTVASFRAIVSCLDSSGNPVNRMTDAFPATLGAATAGGGNARIEATLDLPQPCIAPIIFVTSPGGAWFAVTGQ